MTYRERREAKAERLREWAEKRETDSRATLDHIAEHYRGDHAFNTQPGHIPLRARVIAREDRAFTSLRKANDMNRRAAEIKRQADGAIYDDDPDAIARLRERVAELEAKRETMKAKNAAYRKEHRAELKAMTAYERSHAVPFPSYSLQNLTGNIGRNRDRLARLERQAERTATAREVAGGAFIELTGDRSQWCRVTFAEKPAREILDALKANGYRWAKGSWVGETERLPEGIAQ